MREDHKNLRSRPHRIVLRQLPADEERYKYQLANASPKQLALASFLQRMAFYPREDKEFEKPAPIYLQQAYSITEVFAFEIEIEALLRGRK